MQIHHITPECEGGSGEYDNGIPVCLDCHAEIESKSNMGRGFTAEELKLHRNRWFETVADHPDVLIRAMQTQTETGPLEALLAELDFNEVAVSASDDHFPPLAVKQFERCIATNALSALSKDVRMKVQDTYLLIFKVNHLFAESMGMERVGGRAAALQNARTGIRNTLRGSIPQTFGALQRALGLSA